MPALLGAQLSIVWASEEAFQLLFFWPSFPSALAFIYIRLRDSCYPSSSQVLPCPTHMDYRSSSFECLKCLTYFLCSGRSPKAVCLTVAAATVAHFCRFYSTTGLSCVLRLHRILGTRLCLVIAQAHLLLNAHLPALRKSRCMKDGLQRRETRHLGNLSSSDWMVWPTADHCLQ